MKEEKMISVIVPIYNSEKYLRECLSSVASQTYRNLEIILIDDGSTDRSLEICKEFARQDARFLVISQKNGGEAVARNTGLSAATGEFVLFVDSDDLIFPDICEKAVCTIRDCDVLIFDFAVGQPCKRSAGFAEMNVEAKSLTDFCMEDWITSLLGPTKKVPVTSSLSSVWGKLYRKSFLDKHQILCSAGVVIGTDLLMNLRVFLNQPRVCNLPYSGYFYRYNPASAVHRYNGNIKDSYVLFLSEINRILDEMQSSEAFRHEVGFQEVYSLFQIFSVDIFHPDNPKSNREKRNDFYELLGKEEVCSQISAQQKSFGFAKRCVLTFVKNKWYYPLKVMYLTKDYIRRARNPHLE